VIFNGAYSIFINLQPSRDHCIRFIVISNGETISMRTVEHGEFNFQGFLFIKKDVETL
jgi:hypothetical protein